MLVDVCFFIFHVWYVTQIYFSGMQICKFIYDIFNIMFKLTVNIEQCQSWESVIVFLR